MPRYDYKCPSCGHNYHEVREVTDPLFHPVCNACGAADYIEVTPDV